MSASTVGGILGTEQVQKGSVTGAVVCPVHRVGPATERGDFGTRSRTSAKALACVGVWFSHLWMSRWECALGVRTL